MGCRSPRSAFTAPIAFQVSLNDTAFNLFNVDVSDARNSDEAKLPPEQLMIVHHQ